MLILTDNEPRGLGYLEIDQRASGIPVMPGAGVRLEADTYTCTHCQYIVIMNPLRKRERYKCNGCNHHICDNCAAKLYAGESCKPFKQVVDEELEKATRQPSPIVLLP